MSNMWKIARQILCVSSCLIILILVTSSSFISLGHAQFIYTCDNCIVEKNVEKLCRNQLNKSVNKIDKKLIEKNTFFSGFDVKEIANRNADMTHNQEQNKKINDRQYAVIIVGRYTGILKDAIPKNFQKYYG